MSIKIILNLQKKSILISLLLSLTTYKIIAQVYSSEQNPPSVRWKQINTEKFQVIYQDEFTEEAQRMANILETIIGRVSYSLQKEPKKISIILQNQGTSSNGFVQLAPRRSELFTTPSQSFDYQNWLNSLAVHELRHVVQLDKMTGHLKRPFFESLALAIFGVTLPSWYFEGDAVGIETALTKAGRGRIPEWTLATRTNILSDKKYSYSKDYFGSLNDFTPGYYQLGFLMTTKLRRDYGKDINKDLLTRISNLPIRPYNFTNSVKKLTGYSTRTLHDSTLSELKRLWSNQLSSTTITGYQILNKRINSNPENYLLPVAGPDSCIIFLKDGKVKIPTIFKMKRSGRTERLLKLGIQEIPWFNYANGKIVWDELRWDSRYQQRSFNVINIYDLQTGKSRQITHRSRLFAPSLSPDGKRIITVQVSHANQISLVELNAGSGAVLRTFNSPDNYMLQMPSYDPSGQKIVVVGIADTGKCLYELNTETGKFTQLFSFVEQEILHPVYAASQIIFKAHFNGIDNLYSFSKREHSICQITSAKFGAFNPSYDAGSDKLFFNIYSAQGHDITAIDWNGEQGTDVRSIKDNFVSYAAPLAIQEGNSNVFDSIPNRNYISSPYREINNLFYFHSALPVFEENSYADDYNFGIRLQSDNKLNTLSMYTGYRFNNALRKSEYTAGFSYKRFYPIFTVDYTNRARLIYRRSVSNGQTILSPVNWRENEYELQMTLPFISNKFSNLYSAGFKAGTSYTGRYDVDQPFPNLALKINFPMHYQMYASRNSRRSARDLAPQWGQNFTLSYRHFPFENRLDGDLLTLRTTFYFPGVMTNHSFQVSFNWQDSNGDYRNSVDIPSVSGYSYLSPGANPYNTLLLDYRMPLFYPDWELGPLAYIKRFKAGLFADFQNVKRGNSLSPQSYGAELRADMNLLRFYLPNFDIGGKIIFLNEKSQQKPIFETMATYVF